MILFDFVASAILTWGVGLGLPWIIRHWIVRHPLNLTWSILIAIVLLFAEVIMWEALGSMSRTHISLVWVAFAAGYILHQGHKTSRKAKSEEAKMIWD